jgi:hypothetical protein
MNKQLLPEQVDTSRITHNETAQHVGNVTLQVPQSAPLPGKVSDPTPKADSDPGPPMQAAKGDDDIMSQPPGNVVDAHAVSRAWKRQIGRAKRTWSKLAGADLARVDGDLAKLADLVRRHYSLADSEIERQISGFVSSGA